MAISSNRAIEHQSVADTSATAVILDLTEASALLGLSPNSLFRKLKAGKFPQPVLVGEPGFYAAGWFLEDLLAYAANQVDSFLGDPHEGEQRPERLNEEFVRDVETPGRYGNGRGGFGLSLLVQATKVEGSVSKTWSQRVSLDGRETNVGLGSYPGVTLEEALQRAKKNRRAIKQGRDPRIITTLTFGVAYAKMLERRVKGLGPESGSPAEWAASFRLYADPHIGDLKIDKISSHDIMACLDPIWFTKRVTATKLLRRIKAVMRWAMAHGYIDRDPTEYVRDGLGPNPSRPNHREYLHPDEVRSAITAIEESGSGLAVKGATKFLIATGLRNKEVRGLMWDEIDFAKAVCRIPGSRRKNGQDLDFPLSWAALVILDEARQRTGGVGLVFASPRGKAKMLSGEALRHVLRANGILAVPHGFRTSLTIFAKEKGWDDEIAEAALGHALPPRVIAYLRQQPPELRRTFMDAWATHAGFDSPPIFIPLPSRLPPYVATNPIYEGAQQYFK